MAMRLISLNCHAPRSVVDFDTLPVTMGSGPEADIRLDEHSVSPVHCRIDAIEAGFLVRDLGSLHGTFLDGTRIDEAIFSPGDILAVGMLSFVVQGAPDDEACLQAATIREYETATSA